MRRTLFLVISVALAVMLLAMPVSAKPGGGKGGKGGGGGGGGGGTPTALVTLGDSYISGEAGRWEGNSNSSTVNRGGTDRAAYKRRGSWYVDPSRVYLDGTDASGCHRSDVSEALSSSVPVDTRINLACSGARSVHVRSSASGGQGLNGEVPQADQLAALTATHDVQMIVLSVGGNDLGFADIIIDCTIRYNTSTTWFQNRCAGPQQSNVDARRADAMAGVSGAISDIKAVMAAAGDTDYRLVVQSYPSPIPRAGEFRYSQSGWDRTAVGGCPFWDSDATWARDHLVPQISANLALVAASQGVEFLDLQDMLAGREVCSRSTSHGVGLNAEWARFLVTGLTQGDAQESMHPNAIGQRALATCLDLLAASAPGSYRCFNNAGQGPEAMTLQ